MTSQMRNQLCGAAGFSTVAIVVPLSVRNYIAKLLLPPLANLINGRSLSLIHVMCARIRRNDGNACHPRHCVSSLFALLRKLKPESS